MTLIRWTRAAAADLEQIGTYLKEHNPPLARLTVVKLYEAALSLKRFPNRGRAGSQAGTRELVIPSLPSSSCITSPERPSMLAEGS